MAAHLALEYALENDGATAWWVAPSYDQANNYGFDKMTPLLSPDVLADKPKRTKPRRIDFVNKSSVSFRSAEREDSLRGGGLDFLVIDEAGSVPERAWIEELRPALSDTLENMLAIGTPRGRNWFWKMYKRGQPTDHPDIASWQAPTDQNPHVPSSEIKAAKANMPERVYHQEYEACFVDNTGGVFDNVREQVEDYGLPVESGDSVRPYSIGIDFARFEDYTAIIILDADGRLVAFRRMRETTWHRIQRTVEQLAERYIPNAVSVDATRDNKIVSDLEDAGLTVEPVSFSSSRKRTLIDNLITALEGGEITLSADAPQLINELEIFEFSRTDSGTVSYHAPSGLKDDCVDALALAIEAQQPASSERESFIVTRYD